MDLNTAIDVIESVAGFTDADTSVGEAWAVVMAQLNAAPAPAGEVADLVAALKVIDKMQQEWVLLGNDDGTASPSLTMPISLRRFTVIRDALTRAADLLEQRQAAPVPLLPEGAQVIKSAKHTILVPLQTPVPISEWLPGPEDCDAEGKCWMGYWDSHVNGLGHLHKTWFWTLEDLSMVDEHTHWLPHHALPLPAGEVES